MRRIFLVAVLWCLATGAQAASTIVPNLLPVGIPPNSGLINQNFQNAINDVNALQHLNAGVTAPSNPSLGYSWLSTPQNSSIYELNTWDGTRWLQVAGVDSVNHVWMPPIGGGVPPTILSATTTDLGSVPQAFVYVSGTNPIQSFGTSAPVGSIKVVEFLASTILMSNSSTLIIPGSANLTTAPGDTLLALQVAVGQWSIISYNRASGGTIVQPVIGAPPTVIGDCVAWANTLGSFLADTGQPCGGGGGSGNVVGPSMSTVANCALWANTSGTLLSNSTGPCVLGPTVSTVGDVALFNNTTGGLLSDAGGPPLFVSPPVSGGLLLTSTSSTSIGWAPPVTAVPGTLVGIQIFCADACETDTPPILPFGTTSVFQNCNVSTQCTYTPDFGTVSIVFQGCGAGGSGGGALAASSAGTGSAGAGGGAGTYAENKQVGNLSGISIQVGIGGAAQTAGLPGAAGTSTQTGTFTWGGANGGPVGVTPSALNVRSPNSAAADFLPGTNLTTYLNRVRGAIGGPGQYMNPIGWAGYGASSPLGTGGQSNLLYVTTSAAAGHDGVPGTGFCTGGSGGIDANGDNTAHAGGAGMNGILIIYEYNS